MLPAIGALVLQEQLKDAAKRAWRLSATWMAVGSNNFPEWQLDIPIPL
jgi:hypothetical protein